MLKLEDVENLAADMIGEFFEAENIQRWRTHEVRENYNVVDGSADGVGQWRKEEYEQQLNDGLPVYSINKTSPIVDAITGFAIQNGNRVEYEAREVTNPEQEQRVDRMGAIAKYFEHDGNAEFHESDMFRDTAICGVGSCDFDISYMEPPHDGNLRQSRIFPGFCGWDVNAREKNMLDANHVWQAKIVRREFAEKRLEENGKDPVMASRKDLGRATGAYEFLEFFDLISYAVPLEIIYLFQWREHEPFYRVSNPFTELDEHQANHPLLVNYVSKAEGLYGFKADDLVWNIDKKAYNDFRRDLKFFGLKPDAVKLEKWKYYRSEIVGGVAVDVSENMSQKGFSQKFITGKYSPVDQMYYGAVRAMKSPQRLFNYSTSTLQGFLQNMVVNGVDIESDAVEDLKGFIDTYARSRGKGVSVFKPGALAGGKKQDKRPSMMPAGVMEMIAAAGQAIGEMPGITPAFMGLAESGQEPADLYRQKVRQGLTVLAWLMNARRLFMIEKGRLYTDAAKILGENNPGRPIYNHIAETGEPKHFNLFLEELAEEYDLVVDDAPVSVDEKERIFAQLMGLAEKMPQLATVALEYGPFNSDQREQAKQALMPPPPPEPNPLEVGMIEAETLAKTEKAGLDSAKAEKEKILTLQEIEKLKNGEGIEQGVGLAEKASKDDIERRKLDLEEIRVKADIAEKGKRLELDYDKADMERAKMHIEARKAQMEERKTA